MYRHLLGSSFFAVATLVVLAMTPPIDPPAAAQHAGAVTVEGCLLREADVPGRTRLAERRAPGEDYVLSKAKMIEGSVPETALTAGTVDAPQATPMFRVTGLSQAELQAHARQRVQIDGAFHRDGRVSVPVERRVPTDELLEIHATAIRQLAGECVVE